jgi:hypothetical protein
VPWRIRVQLVRPDFDTVIKDLPDDKLGTHHAAGDTIMRNDDGSILCSPNMSISRRERWKQMQKYQFEAQARHEAIAKPRG